MSRYRLILIVTMFLYSHLYIFDCQATQDYMPPDSDSPSFSPDGSKIVFISNVVEGNPDLWTINTDGTDLKRLTSDETRDFGPAWSPDGSKIVFSSDRINVDNFDIWVINADGTNLKRLTSESSREDSPAWSPDGSKIAFFCDGIWIMNADGTNRKRLLSWGNCPTWSPDGSKIAFLSSFHDEKGKSFFNLWIINADSTGLKQLTFGDYADMDPAWAPDGSKIIFISDRSGKGFDIWKINVDGSGLEQITNTSGAGSDEYNPAWSLDGTQIVYSRDLNIWIMDAYGRNQRQITHFEAYSIPFKKFNIKHIKIHWQEGKVDFIITGRFKLPEDYKRSDLKKETKIYLNISKENALWLSRRTSIVFKERGLIWFYRANPDQQTEEGLNIEKMIIFWHPEKNKTDKNKPYPAGESWFFIKGSFKVEEQERKDLLTKANFTLNIPIENITTAGSLQSTSEIEFKVQKDLWLYHSPKEWPDWQENWWEKMEPKD